MTDAMAQPDTPADTWLLDLFESHPDALLLLAPDHTVRRANPSACRLYGARPGGLIGLPARGLVPPDMADKWDHDFAKLLAGDWNFLETYAATPQGRPVPIAVHGIRTRAGGRLAIILHIHDLSIYRNIERALLASNYQWDQCFDAITDSLCVLDRNGLILRANRTMNERFASSTGSLTGLDYRAVLGVAECTGPGHPYPHAVHQAPFTLESVRLPARPGAFTLMAYPLQRETGNPSGAVLVIRDTTENHETREALSRTEASLFRAAKMEAIGRLAGGVAHDFNNILTTILGYSSIALRNLRPDDPVRDDLREIVAAGERASALTRQLLDFSHDRAIETRVVNLNDMLRNMERFLRRTLGEDMRLIVRLDPALWPVNVDVSRMEQVVMNLVVNARDALDAGGTLAIETGNAILDRVFCEARPDIAPGEYVRIEVSDTGHGMPPEVLSHIFEPFFTTKPRGHGTGIGLTTVYGIVRQFQGCILCYSEVHKGTTFKIYLPRAIGPSAGDAPAASAAEPAAVPRGTERVLVVDDEPNIAQVIAHILGDVGYRVLTAASGAEALARFDQVQGQVDVLLADIGMPDLTGPELYQRLRERRPGLKVLFMSGYASPTDLERAPGAEAVAFIQKPFSFETLGGRIREILDRDKPPPSPDTPERTPS
jgi:PAS domain S-box-containing protein